MQEVEWETLKWLDWYNKRRLLGTIGYTPQQKYRRRVSCKPELTRYGCLTSEQTTSGKPGAVQNAPRRNAPMAAAQSVVAALASGWMRCYYRFKSVGVSARTETRKQTHRT